MRWLRLPVRRPRHDQGTSYTLVVVPRPPIPSDTVVVHLSVRTVTIHLIKMMMMLIIITFLQCVLYKYIIQTSLLDIHFIYVYNLHLS